MLGPGLRVRRLSAVFLPYFLYLQKQQRSTCCGNIIQAGETCSPDEQLTDHLLFSSAYECDICWGGWMSVPAFHSVSSDAKQQADHESASNSFLHSLQRTRGSSVSLRALPSWVLATAVDAGCVQVPARRKQPPRSTAGLWNLG